jgi:hypothetical protein
MEYPAGFAKPDRYELWFNTRLRQKYRDQLTGKQCYQLRSSMLQEKPMLRQRLSSDRVVFLIPGSGSSVGPTMRANRGIYLDPHISLRDDARHPGMIESGQLDGARRNPQSGNR